MSYSNAAKPSRSPINQVKSRFDFLLMNALVLSMTIACLFLSSSLAHAKPMSYMEYQDRKAKLDVLDTCSVDNLLKKYNKLRLEALIYFSKDYALSSQEAEAYLIYKDYCFIQQHIKQVQAWAAGEVGEARDGTYTRDLGFLGTSKYHRDALRSDANAKARIEQLNQYADELKDSWNKGGYPKAFGPLSDSDKYPVFLTDPKRTRSDIVEQKILERRLDPEDQKRLDYLRGHQDKLKELIKDLTTGDELKLLERWLRTGEIRKLDAAVEYYVRRGLVTWIKDSAGNITALIWMPLNTPDNKDKLADNADENNGSIDKSKKPCIYNYSPWSSCDRNTNSQTRRVISKTPKDCVVTKQPTLSQPCTPPPTEDEKKRALLDCLCRCSSGKNCGKGYDPEHKVKVDVPGPGPCYSGIGCYGNSFRLFLKPSTACAGGCWEGIYGKGSFSQTKLDRLRKAVNKKFAEPLKVEIIAKPNPAAFGDIVELTAVPKGGVGDYEYHWGGCAQDAEGPKAKVVNTRSCSRCIATVWIRDQEQTIASATKPILCQTVKVTLNRVNPGPATVNQGDSIAFDAVVTAGGLQANGPFIYYWEPNPDVLFGSKQNPSYETRGGNRSFNTAIFHRPGQFKVWVTVLKNIEGKNVTLGESQQIIIKVLPPATENDTGDSAANDTLVRKNKKYGDMLRLARQYWSQGEVDKAADMAQQAHALLPGSKEADQLFRQYNTALEQIKGLVRTAEAALNNKLFPEAIGHLESGRRINQKSKRLDVLEKKIRSASAGMANQNLARGKPAKQSSVYRTAGASQAVDGNRDGNYFAGSVAHTWENPQAWWQVDLGAVYQIDQVVIYNRTDCCSEKLSNFSLWVTKTDVAGSNLAAPGIWRRNYPGKAGRKTVFKVNHPGRFVRVQLNGENYLHMAEVEVYGRYIGPYAGPKK